jgi:hypothetical protein
VIVLLDTNESQWNAAPGELGGSVEVGQLLTPLTRFKDRGARYGIDNGAFSDFKADGFLSLLDRQKESRDRCIFVAAPDVVGSARRTLECFDHWFPKLNGWPVALVMQDGQEDLSIPWKHIRAAFIGGSTAWKCGPAAAAIVKAAKVMGKWAHIGRVNTPDRFAYFESMGADSIDGSGISRFSHMRRILIDDRPTLLAELEDAA